MQDMSTSTIDRPIEKTTTRKLNRAWDRCDRCGAQAFVAVTVPAKGKPVHVEMLFCGHHYGRYEQHFAAKGYPVHDERHLINAKPSTSANAD